jgi:uncharacterized coiled-coil protein SlyX
MPVEKDMEEFELIPVSPIRKLEKRLEQLEIQSKTFDSREFYKDLVEIMRMNQQLVDELAKANDALKIEIARLPAKLEELISKLDELISFIKATSIEEPTKPPEELTPLVSKLDQLVETNRKIVENNESVLALLDDISKKLRRPPLQPMRRPILPPPPRPVQ